MEIAGRDNWKLILDVVFLVNLVLLTFLRVVVKFGYMEVHLFYYVLIDSTEDLGFPVFKEGKECLDVLFLENCEFFDRFYISKFVFGFFFAFTSVFTVLSILTTLLKGKTNNQLLNTWVFHYLNPISFILAFGVLVFYSHLFDDDITGVKGKFNIRYVEGAYLMWTSLAISLASVGLYTFCDSSQAENKETLLSR